VLKESCTRDETGAAGSARTPTADALGYVERERAAVSAVREYLDIIRSPRGPATDDDVARRKWLKEELRKWLPVDRWAAAYAATALGNAEMAQAVDSADASESSRVRFSYAARILRIAIRSLDRAEATEEIEHLSLLERRAEALAYSGQHQEALAALNDAAKAWPLDTEHSRTRARLLGQQGALRQAHDEWQRVLALEPADLEARLQIGRCCLDLVRGSDRGRQSMLYEQAERLLGEARELAEPADRHAVEWLLGDLCHSRRDVVGALDHYRVSAALKGDDEQLQLDFAIRLCDAGHYDECTSQCARLLGKRQGLIRANSLNLMAYAAAEKDTGLDEARGWIDEAIQTLEVLRDTVDGPALKSATAAFLDTKGWILVKQGDVEQGLALLERAIATEGDSGRYWHLCLAYLARLRSCPDYQGRWDMELRLARCCQHVLDLDPETKYREDAMRLLAEFSGRVMRTA
jgi:tetratricopeptide (TPR) repeat protein